MNQASRQMVHLGWIVGLIVLLVGCDRIRMREQPSVQPYEPNAVFEDRQSARPLPEGTVPRGFGERQIASGYAADFASGRTVRRADAPEIARGGPYPVKVTREFLARGRDNYQAFCSPCHGATGRGNGIVVQRGMVKPPSYHVPRLREQSPQYYYDVITKGFGRMYSYASRVPPRDRWAIAAYIEALQLSQHAPVEQLEAQDRRRLERSR